MADGVKTAAPPAEPPQALGGNLGWLLSQASYALSSELTVALEELGITPRSFCLLKTARSGEFTQIELAQAVGLDKTTMVVTLDELEEAGLARRRPSSEDRRARVVEVTKAGERMIAKASEIVERVQREVLEELSTGEREALLEGLNRLVGDRLSCGAECSQPVRRRAPRA